MGSKKQTIGYHYIMTLLSGLCRGPVNELRGITVGGKVAFDANFCDDVPMILNLPNLFGGEEKEGGIIGAARLYMGPLDQVLDDEQIVVIGSSGPLTSARLRNLRNILPGRVSQLRGIVTFHFNGIIAALNPYPKEWAYRLRRTTKGWVNDLPWYAPKATIWMGDGHIMAMNPTHMIYQLLTDPDWGGAEDTAEIDEPSFIYAANVLCDEGFGLCMKWERKDDVDKFIKTVLDHIGGALFQDRETGLFTLKLIRDDYDPDDLPHFTPDSGLVEITEDDSEAVADAINEVIATGTNPLDFGADIQVRAQNIAAIQAVGGRVSSPVTYPGVPTSSLLQRLAERDLKAASLGLKRFTVKLDRSAWRLYPAMPFKVSDPKRGIAEIVLRVGEVIDENDMQDGFIQVRAIEDVFSMPFTAFTNPSDSEWEGASQIALPAVEERLVEASYRDVYVQRGAADADALTDTDALIGQLAAAANSSNREYDLYTRVSPDAYVKRATGFFTDFGELVAPLDFYDDTLQLENLTTGFDAAAVVGSALLIGDEMVGVVSYDAMTDTFTISRGTVDTLPQQHLAGARAWTIDDDIVGDGILYQDGETVNSKVLSKTSSDIMDLDEADEQEIDLVARQARPYPPADMKVDGDLALTIDGTPRPEPAFTWAERDRKLQDDALVDHQEATIGPEPGVTYTFRIYDFLTDTLLNTYSGITGDTWTYDSTLQTADGNPTHIRVEIEAERDTLTSYQKYDFSITLSGGYGYGYGFNYGGA